MHTHGTSPEATQAIQAMHAIACRPEHDDIGAVAKRIQAHLEVVAEQFCCAEPRSVTEMKLFLQKPQQDFDAFRAALVDHVASVAREMDVAVPQCA